MTYDFALRYRVGKVKSATGVHVESTKGHATITFDPAKVTKGDVYKLVRSQLMYFENRIIERILARLITDRVLRSPEDKP